MSNLPPFNGFSPSPPPMMFDDPNTALAKQLLIDLCNPELRANALQELQKIGKVVEDFALLLWNSYGTIAALLQEIVSTYRFLSPPILSQDASKRVCNAVTLLQSVASHPDTRIHFLNAHVPLYLYPFLYNTSKAMPLEYLRVSSLGVIGALVKAGNTEIIIFLLQTELIPLCLRTMEIGDELSKTVATFIVHKILMDEYGLWYICCKEDRFYALCAMLSRMVAVLADQPSPKLLKHIIGCYRRLSDYHRHEMLPNSLKDGTFHAWLREIDKIQQYLEQLPVNVNRASPACHQGGRDHMS